MVCRLVRYVVRVEVLTAFRPGSEAQSSDAPSRVRFNSVFRELDIIYQITRTTQQSVK